MTAALPFPPLNAKRTRARIDAIMRRADRRAQTIGQAAYAEPSPILDAYWAHLDHLASREGAR